MSTVINTNLLALNTQRQLSKSSITQQNAMARLSSGLRINSAKDDAAGLAISDRITSQTRGIAVAVRNLGDGISLAQTAEGALGSIGTNLQRIRELALQSANGANTEVDRKAIQVEVQQLKDEIQSVSDRTNFNGRKLLDGSFGSATLQTGANVGETISVSLSGARTDQLGAGTSAGVSTVQASLAAVGGSTARATTMAANDIIINGVAVGAALAGKDGSSSTLPASSGIAVAAAINLVSDTSGVTAIVNATSARGSSTASVTTAAASVTINGVSITINGTGVAANLMTDLHSVADQINLNKDQTGVVASVDDNNPGAGVMLTAADGRNINVGGAVTGYGLAAATTYFGGVTLVSNAGEDITVTSATGNSLENVGIETGTYSANKATAVSANLSGSSMLAGDLVVNGVTIGASQASYDNASYGTARAMSAIAVASTINLASASTGVTATAGPTTLTSGAVAASTAAAFSINGVSFTVAAGATTSTSEQVGLYVDAINSKSSQTGVRAVVNSATAYTLVADDGRNIVTTAAGGLSAAVTTGTVRLTSGDKIDISTKTGTIANSGFTVGSYGSNSSGQFVKDIDVSTVTGATKALNAIDNALANVNSQRANMGAMQNRLDSTISNLQLNAENLTAANSRIKDADFAMETGELSRSQILQQAGTAMLAQANSSSQGVLSLLR
jgi:flagellin